MLGDLARFGEARPFGRMGFYFQLLESRYLKESLAVPPGVGAVLVNRTVPVAGIAAVLRAGDAVTAIDGVPVADDGTVAFRDDERIAFGWLLTSKYLGDDLAISIIREGKPLTVHAPLEDVPDLVPRTLYERKPQYVVHCGLVFTPLSEPYLAAAFSRDWEVRAPIRHVYETHHGVVRTPGQQIVLLTSILSNAVTVGYEAEECVRGWGKGGGGGGRSEGCTAR